MKANYHTHTWRCNHAVGTEREYIERAIQGGIRVLGFSDHTPYPFPEGTDIRTRMRLDQMEDYVETVLRLKEEYRQDIELHLGLEVEYFPAYFDALTEFLKPYPVEYLILGQHYLQVSADMPFVGRACPAQQEEERLRQYVDLCIAGMETGRFACLCHPDLCRFTGDGDFYRSQMRRLCAAMERLQIPAEINLLGIWDHRHYPVPAFWEIAAEYRLSVILGSDAHCPEQVWDSECEQKGLELVQRFGLTLTQQLAL